MVFASFGGYRLPNTDRAGVSQHHLASRSALRGVLYFSLQDRSDMQGSHVSISLLRLVLSPPLSLLLPHPRARVYLFLARGEHGCCAARSSSSEEPTVLLTAGMQVACGHRLVGCRSFSNGTVTENAGFSLLSHNVIPARCCRLSVARLCPFLCLTRSGGSMALKWPRGECRHDGLPLARKDRLLRSF